MATKKTKPKAKVVAAKKPRATTTKRVRTTRLNSEDQNQFVSMMVPVFTVLSIAFLVLVMVKYM